MISRKPLVCPDSIINSLTICRLTRSSSRRARSSARWLTTWACRRSSFFQSCTKLRQRARPRLRFRRRSRSRNRPRPRKRRRVVQTRAHLSHLPHSPKNLNLVPMLANRASMQNQPKRQEMYSAARLNFRETLACRHCNQRRRQRRWTAR